jgi:hypothetical protein
MKKSIQFCLIITAFVISVSCNKSVDPQPAVVNGTLLLHLHTNVDTAEVDLYGSVLTMTGGRRISVDSAQLYISHIQLVKSDNSIYDVPNTIILQVQNQETYTVGDVPAGNYKSIKFYVGLDPATNQKVPSGSDILNSPGMWFGSTAQPAGYVFINFKGTIDTTSAGTGALSDMRPFNYKIGTNANYVQVTMPDQAYTVVPGQSQIIHIITDYNKLFTSIPLPLSIGNRTVITPADNSNSNKPIIDQIKTNISSMFKYEM